MPVDIQETRSAIRVMFRSWGIDPSEWEILWDSELGLAAYLRTPGATVRYLRKGQWQFVICRKFEDRGKNLRQVFLFLDRVRIAEKNGMEYQGLTHTTEVTKVNQESNRREALLDAYDTLGASPDDPVELIEDIYRKKSMYYHPDKPGGDAEKFMRITKAKEIILESRGKPR